MKTVDDMTPEELLALYDDQAAFERQVDLECAHDGVPLLPPHPTPPEDPGTGPDLTYFRVALNVVVTDRGVPDALCSAVDAFRAEFGDAEAATGRYSYGGPEVFRPRNSDLGPAAVPEPVKLWSRSHYDKHKVSQEAYRQAKAEHDSDLRAYEKAAKDRAGVAEEVRRRVFDVAQERREEERAREEFARYVDLADGDRDVALKFFEKASGHPKFWLLRVLGMDVVAAEGGAS